MDQDLLREAQGGNGDAFGSLVAGSIDRCYAVAYRILRDVELAHDAVQGALIGAWTDLPSLRDPSRFDAWLTRLVVNACYTEARRERRWTAKLRLVPPEIETLPDAAISVADRDELDRAFRRLPVEQRAVVVLHHYAGLTSAEVASTLHVPPGTVRSRLHHATRQLRAAIEADARPASTTEGRSA
jgi:RNA polymerase sigma-70 factor (ECF subfamily)